MYSRLQYISQGQHYENIEAALDAGCSWVQLRAKQLAELQLLQLAIRVQRLCESYNATFIVNDHAQIALEAGADGVHLGLDDGSIAEARAILGNDKIIGGTANTLAHLQQRVAEGCNYIGLGPFRFTTTKAKLSPILGLEGYRSLLSQPITIPVYAIGGILPEDVESLMTTGVYGVCVSGVITQALDRKQIVQQLNHSLYGSLANSR